MGAVFMVATLSACSEAPPPATDAVQRAAGRVEVIDGTTPAPAGKVVGVPAASPAVDSKVGADGVTELDWDALIPDDYRPDKLMEEYKIDELEDDDPRAAELMEELQALWDKAPVRDDIDGVSVRLPGFVVPVEGDEQETTGFLLVPYYGACIHVPPPPANQTVYVLTESGKGVRPGLFDVVWVTGTMSVKRTETEMADAGYTLYATDVAPYE